MPAARPDLVGRVIVITGANTGIGEASAYQLASRGASLWLACRSEAKTQPVLAQVRALQRAAGALDATAEFVELDLASLASVRSCATKLARLLVIDVLVLNAGVGGQRGTTADGFELHFGVNHLGHYLLTRMLIDVLARSKAPRLVVVASNSHKQAQTLEWAALQQATRTFSGKREYEVSKLCNVLFMHEFTKRVAADAQAAPDDVQMTQRARIRTYALNPGRVATDVWRRIPAPVREVWKRFMLTADQGGAFITTCAVDEALAGETGQYYSRGQRHVPSLLARDTALAAQLWDKSAQWVGLPSDMLE